jgi:hypothetical protein
MCKLINIDSNNSSAKKIINASFPKLTQFLITLTITTITTITPVRRGGTTTTTTPTTITPL